MQELWYSTQGNGVTAPIVVHSGAMQIHEQLSD